MDYINKTFLKGRLGKDPDLRFLPSGDAVINFSLATMSGQHVEWHPIVAYKGLAERAKAEFGSGDVVYIEGEIRTREMQTAEDKAANRKPRKIREVIASALHLVEKNKKNAAAGGDPLPPGEDDSTPPDDNPPEPDGSIPSYI